MLKIAKTYGILFISVIIGLFVSCQPRTYNNNNTYVSPSGINYSYYNYGSGTSTTTGAMLVNIHSSSTNTYNEYYVVQIFGVGAYTIQPGYNQLSIGNMLGNSYSFSIEKVCTSGNNTTCTSLTLTGTAIINAETTTVVDAWM